MVLGTNAIPLADAAALNLIAPLLITIGAIFFFKETVGPRRWLALAVGATGALVVVRPGFQDLDLGIGLVSLTIIFSAGQRLVSKSLPHGSKRRRYCTLCSLCALPLRWQPRCLYGPGLQSLNWA